MQSTRRSVVLAVAVAACLAALSAVSSLVSAGRALVSTAAAYVLTGLSLFSEPKH